MAEDFGNTAMKLGDDDPMPFGKYGPEGKGCKMADVPADYLLYLWDDEQTAFWDEAKVEFPAAIAVRDYIIRRFNHLETECPDRIIRHRP